MTGTPAINNLNNSKRRKLGTLTVDTRRSLRAKLVGRRAKVR